MNHKMDPLIELADSLLWTLETNVFSAPNLLTPDIIPVCIKQTRFEFWTSPDFKNKKIWTSPDLRNKEFWSSPDLSK